MKRAMYPILITMIMTLVALPAEAADPMDAPNDTWISVSGTVLNVDRDAFSLDYGEGVIIVEMDDGDRDADAYKLLAGDKVTVSGMVDDGLLERRTIEAASVYVEKIGTTFYASAMDEESVKGALWAVPVVVSHTQLGGVVTDVEGNEQFTIDTGKRKIDVTVESMAYNPLDDIGYQRIDEGDYVSVTGRMSADLFEGREFVADSVVTIIQ